jgi:hypothetical protein
MSLTLIAMILSGFVAGYFLATPVLIVITAVAIVVGIGLWVTSEELAILYALAYVACAIIALTCMWTTHYSVTQQTWIGDFVKHYVLR